MTKQAAPTKWADTTARRVAIRLAYLGWTQEHLGIAIATAEGRDNPLATATIRKALRGRPVKNPAGKTLRHEVTPEWLRRMAIALGCPIRTLYPRRDFEGLVKPPRPAFPVWPPRNATVAAEGRDSE